MAKAKKRSPASTSATRAPVIDLDLNLPARSGIRLNAKALSHVFSAAWNLVPAERRPELSKPYIALDIHAVSDTEIAPLNWKFMKHKGPTDVLSFPLGDFDPARRAYHLGEIIVSYDTAKREAKERKLSCEEEFTRYCVHGFLHLLGYDDATTAQRKAMFTVQEKALDAI